MRAAAASVAQRRSACQLSQRVADAAAVALLACSSRLPARRGSGSEDMAGFVRARVRAASELAAAALAWSLSLQPAAFAVALLACSSWLPARRSACQLSQRVADAAAAAASIAERRGCLSERVGCNCSGSTSAGRECNATSAVAPPALAVAASRSLVLPSDCSRRCVGQLD